MKKLWLTYHFSDFIFFVLISYWVIWNRSFSVLKLKKISTSFHHWLINQFLNSTTLSIIFSGDRVDISSIIVICLPPKSNAFKFLKRYKWLLVTLPEYLLIQWSMGSTVYQVQHVNFPIHSYVLEQTKLLDLNEWM